MKQVLAYIDEHRDEYVALLQTLCRQPSIAFTGEGIDDMIALVTESLRGVGMEPTLYQTAGNPVIYAEQKGKSKRVFGLYGHYDVQPVDPVELWKNDPFSAMIIDNVIYARGVADNKNGIASKICAVDAWQKVHGALPCGVKFVLEGEEEIGSPNLPQFAREHADLLVCDGYNWEGGWREKNGAPEIHLGNKGLLYLEFRCKTASTDAHSRYGAIVENAAWRLIRMLSTLKSEDGTINVDGFYDDVIPMTQADVDNLLEDNFSEEDLKTYLGIDGFVGGLTGLELLKRHYYAPTANICGLAAGITADGVKTIIPAEASAKMDFRLVPGQDPEKIHRLILAHLKKHGFEDIQVLVRSSQPAFRAAADSDFIKAVKRALTGLFGEVVVHNITAGTTPMSVFNQAGTIPVAMFGCTSSTSNIHAPNEHMSVASFVDDIKIIASVMHELGNL